MTMIDALNLNHLGQPPVQCRRRRLRQRNKWKSRQFRIRLLFLKWTTRLLSLRPRRLTRPPRRLTVRCRRFLRIPNRCRRSVPPFHAGLQTKISPKRNPRAASKGRSKPAKKRRTFTKRAVRMGFPPRRFAARTGPPCSSSTSSGVARLHASKFGQVFVPPRMANYQRLQEFNNMSRPYVSSDIFARNGFTWAIGV